MPGERTEKRAKGLERARRLGRAARPARIEAQRELLLEAMVGAAAAKGYEACRVEDVLGRSGLSRSTFYLHFTDKADCFIAAFERAADALLEAVREAAAAVADPRARAEAGVEALLVSLAEDPAMARLALVEIRTAGPEGQRRYEAASKRFASLLAGGGCPGRVGPGTETERAERAVEAVATVLWLEVGSGRAESLQRLAPALVALAGALAA